MKFAQLLQTVREEPVFETGVLLAGDVNPDDVRRQLSRWTRAGRIHQLRRGLYALAPPYAQRKVHPFLLANRLMRGSYVSLQSALSHHGLIPESVPVVTSVGFLRPGRRETPLGAFEFRHLKPRLVDGYVPVPVDDLHTAFVASAEKAVLDLCYLEPHGDRRSFIESLRLQNLDRLELDRLGDWVGRWGSQKMIRVARILESLAHAEREEYQSA